MKLNTTKVVLVKLKFIGIFIDRLMKCSFSEMNSVI